MAVYNVSKYLDEAVNSLVDQTIGFENVQLILVDDGSTDNCGQICDQWHDRYPENILALHKPNGGQGSARNMGIEYAEGKVINFMDPDDKLSPETLKAVCDFFDAHGDETDVAAIPMYFFGAKTGPHWQNYKFSQGTRVIDLTLEYKNQQTSASSSFFNAEKLKQYRFDTSLSVNEDFKMVLLMLSEKQTIGAVADGRYWYRRRDDNSSTMQNSFYDIRYYTTWFEGFGRWVVEHFRNLYGKLPLWTQYALLSDFYWRVVTDYDDIINNVLPPEQVEEYVRNMQAYVQAFDDKMIMAVDSFAVDFRYWLLRLKHDGGDVRHIQTSERVVIRYADSDVVSAENLETFINSVKQSDNAITITGLVCFLPGENIENTKIYLVSGESWIPCKSSIAKAKTKMRLGRPAIYQAAFSGCILLRKKQPFFEISVGVEYPDQIRIIKSKLSAGPTLPLCENPIGTAELNDYKYYLDGQLIRFQTYGTLLLKIKRELGWILTMLRTSNQRALIYRLLSHTVRLFNRKKIWLISDSLDTAGGSGEAFFRYLLAEQKQHVKPYFLLPDDSKDYLRLKKKFGKRLIPPWSKKHKVFSLAAGAVVSSSPRGQANEPFSGINKTNNDLLLTVPFIYLPSQCLLREEAQRLNVWNQDFSGFAAASEQEAMMLQRGQYGYDAERIWLTGLPCFDGLDDGGTKRILFIPEWREYLMKVSSKSLEDRELNEGFEESEYYAFYHHLLTNKQVLQTASEKGYELFVLAPPRMTSYMARLDIDPAFKIVSGEGFDRKDLSGYSLVVTDYSLLSFDFAYLRRPVIYCRFDAEKLKPGEKKTDPSYFDYEEDGFGPVCGVPDEAAERIIECMDRDCALTDFYAERISRYFLFDDQNNCGRIYNRIASLMKKT